MANLLPCPFCGKSNFDQWPCDWLDGSGANVVRCAWCHGAAPMDVWNRRAAPVVDEAMVDRYLEAQKAAVAEADRKWGNIDARAACRVGLTAALAQQPGTEVDRG